MKRLALLVLVACGQRSAPPPTVAAALEGAKVRAEKTTRIEAVVRGALAGKLTRGEGASKQQQRDDEQTKLKTLRTAIQAAIDPVVGEVGALGVRVTLFRPLPDRLKKQADKEKEVIGTLTVPPCPPDSPKVQQSIDGDLVVDHGLFKLKWGDDAGDHGDGALHPGFVVTRRIFFGGGVEVPLETSGAHVPADIEARIESCYLLDDTPRPQ